MQLDHALELRIEPPKDGRCRVTVTVGGEPVIVSELVSEEATETVCKWLRGILGLSSEVVLGRRPPVPR